MRRGLDARVVERIRRDFPQPAVAALVTRRLEEWGDAWPDWEVGRVQAAIVLGASGDLDRLTALVELAYRDFRDVLMAAGFADANWRERMDAAFER